MICIYCQTDLMVSNSRPQKSRNQTWRRRLCKGCAAVFTTVEAIDLSQSLTLSAGSTGRKGFQNAKVDPSQPFSRDRLFISIYESLRHRPTAASDARGLSDTIVALLIKQSDHGSLPVHAVTATTLKVLRRFDQAAATHYAAFHPE